MRYNRALDLLCAAAEYQRANKPNSAAKAFLAACRDSSIVAALNIVEANNKVAYAKLVKASRIKAKQKSLSARKVRAGIETNGIEEDSPGDEFRVEPTENGDRVIQEADFDEMVGDDDFDEDDMVLSSADDEESDEESDEEDEEDTKAKKVKSSASSFARALANFEHLKSK